MLPTGNCRSSVIGPPFSSPGRPKQGISMKLEPDSPSSHSEHGREKQSFLWELAHFRALLDQSNDSIEVVDPVTLRFLDANKKAFSKLESQPRRALVDDLFRHCP